MIRSSTSPSVRRFETGGAVPSLGTLKPPRAANPTTALRAACTGRARAWRGGGPAPSPAMRRSSARQKSDLRQAGAAVITEPGQTFAPAGSGDEF